MKKWIQKMLTLCLAAAMIVTAFAPVTTEAKTKSMTLYKGEKIYYTNFSKVTGVSSSKKSVVAIAKDKKQDSHANITAKKTGKSTVTIKTKGGTVKYVVTVKPLSFTVKVKDMGNGNALLCIKNNTKQTFEQIAITYYLRDAAGNVFDKDTVTLYDSVAGKWCYRTVYYSSYTYSMDAAQSSAKVVGVSHDPGHKYTNQTSKIAVSSKVSGDQLVIKTKNKSKSYVNGYNYILFYDAAGQIIEMRTDSIYLKAGALNSSSISLPYNGYDHYEIKTAAYSESY